MCLSSHRSEVGTNQNAWIGHGLIQNLIEELGLPSLLKKNVRKRRLAEYKLKRY